MRRVAKLICILTAGCVPGLALAGPTLTTIYTFTGGADGGSPGAGLVEGRHGVLYGTTEAGGAGAAGTVFQLAPPRNGAGAYALTTLHSFAGGDDGADPTNIVADRYGNLYGVTSAGGGSSACSGGCGTVFALTPPAPGETNWSETVLHAFSGAADGRFPSGLAFDDDGNLYGFTWGGSGACHAGCGTVYELRRPRHGGSWQYATLYTFANDADGHGPFGIPLIDRAGAIYGIAYSGGTGAATPDACAPFVGCGEVFKLTPPDDDDSTSATWTKSTLWAFDGANGTGAFNSLTMDEHGNLLGLTNEGGTSPACPAVAGAYPAGCGTAFELDRPTSRGGAWSERVIWNFTSDADSAYPADSKLTPVAGGYVASTSGGSTDPIGLYGAIVEFVPPGHGRTAWTEKTLFTFANDANGAVPVGVLLEADGAIYGTTYGYSGPAAAGTVFKLVP
ncbi:MAG TPA: choice-of-anchor tandem repeat GloVer-containing protein [Rudaea sp.]|nr:choice-of-anchor tandem repeat GloVer-containing protein [Rudaea sp.]